MTYAILQHGGRQYRVSAGDRLLVDRLPADVGSIVALEPVLLVGDEGGKVSVGTPAVDGVRVAAEVVSHRRGRKLRIFKYKPKKRYRKTMGFRADLTELRVESVLAKGEKLPEAKKTEKAAPTGKKPVDPKPWAKSQPKSASASAAEADVEETRKAKATTTKPAAAKESAAEAPVAESRPKAAKKPAKAEKDETTDGA